MGSVWRAQHLGLNAPVAIKLMDSALAATAEGRARFHREAQAAAALRSPHVVQVLDHGFDESSHQPFIVMELMDGESLAERLKRLARLSPQETARVVTHVARALARAHGSGIVHRDLKPDNVFVVQNEDEEVAKVLDFGIAKSQAHQLGPGAATQTGAIMGTVYYMSPEQITGSKNVDFRTDLWALGVIACECLTGQRPFQAETIGGMALKICVELPLPPSDLGPVPSGFDAWFARATARDMNARFQSARELADALRLVCDGAEQVDLEPRSAMLATQPHFVRTETALSRSTGGSGALESSGAELEFPVKRSSARVWAVALVLAAATVFVVVWLQQRPPAPGSLPSASAASVPARAMPTVTPAPPPAEPAPAGPQVEPLPPTPPSAAQSTVAGVKPASRPARQRPPRASVTPSAEPTPARAVVPSAPVPARASTSDVLDERR
jgi:serine/threonine-protein kinase